MTRLSAQAKRLLATPSPAFSPPTFPPASVRQAFTSPYSLKVTASTVQVFFLHRLVAIRKTPAPWRCRQNDANRRFAGVSYQFSNQSKWHGC
jgi:hypothetical protein